MKRILLLLLTLSAVAMAFAENRIPEHSISKGRSAEKSQEWKYVQVRRYVASLEASLKKDTRWVVYEPNNETLWTRVRQTVTNRLTTEWRNGKLLGTKVEQAFFVNCDKTTMTQLDIANGLLICYEVDHPKVIPCNIGIAPLKPAEFVSFQLQQNTALRKRRLKK